MGMLDYEVFEEALALFHQYSRQNGQTVVEMQRRLILPKNRQPGFGALDVGAGQGYLSSLMAPLVEQLVLVEPNPRCVQTLKAQFPKVYPQPWSLHTAETVRMEYPQGFNLVTMSHMLYHFADLDQVKKAIDLALGCVKPGGSLVIVLNTPSALMARIGVAYRQAVGRLDDAFVNQQIHAHCLSEPFYHQAFQSSCEEIEIQTVATPLCDVPNVGTLVELLRMCLLNPLSDAPFDESHVDGFIRQFVEDHYPGLSYPATLESLDKLIVLRRKTRQLTAIAG